MFRKYFSLSTIFTLLFLTTLAFGIYTECQRDALEKEFAAQVKLNTHMQARYGELKDTWFDDRDASARLSIVYRFLLSKGEKMLKFLRPELIKKAIDLLKIWDVLFDDAAVEKRKLKAACRALNWRSCQ